MMDYKEKYATELSTLRSHLKQGVDRQDAISSWTYFNKFLRLTSVYDTVRDDCLLDGVEMAYGNLNSPIVLILPSFESPKSKLFISKLREYLESLSTADKTYHFSEICVLSYGKGSPYANHSEVLALEVGIIQPQVIISLVKMNIAEMDVRYLDFTPEVMEDDEQLSQFLSVIPEKLN